MNGILGHRYKSTTPRAFKIINAANQSISIIQQDKCKRYSALLKKILINIKVKFSSMKVKNQITPLPDAIKETTMGITSLIEKDATIPSEDKPVLISAMTSFIEVALRNSTDSNNNADIMVLIQNVNDILDSFCPPAQIEAAREEEAREKAAREKAAQEKAAQEKIDQLTKRSEEISKEISIIGETRTKLETDYSKIGEKVFMIQRTGSGILDANEIILGSKIINKLQDLLYKDLLKRKEYFQIKYEIDVLKYERYPDPIAHKSRKIQYIEFNLDVFKYILDKLKPLSYITYLLMLYTTGIQGRYWGQDREEIYNINNKLREAYYSLSDRTQKGIDDEIKKLINESDKLKNEIKELKKSGVSTFGGMSTPSAKKKCNIFVLLILGFAIYWFFFMRKKGGGSLFGKRRRR